LDTLLSGYKAIAALVWWDTHAVNRWPLQLLGGYGYRVAFAVPVGAQGSHCGDDHHDDQGWQQAVFHRVRSVLTQEIFLILILPLLSVPPG